MVALEAIRASNAKLRNLPPGLVAVFVGATSGIGESTLKQFCRHTIKPRVYFVGRSQDAANRIISEIKTIQPDTVTTFIRKDLTLLKNVDEVCDEIKAKEKNLNLLFMSQGTMSVKGRDVSVLGPGEEDVLDFGDLDLQQNFSLKKAAAHAITMTDFTFEELAKRHPSVSFVHAYPGIVKTGFAKNVNFAVRAASQLTLIVLSRWTVGIEESGERHLYVATSAAYPPSAGEKCGVELGGGGVKKGSAGAVGSGAYLIGSDGEVRANEKVLKELRNQDAGVKIWEHTMKTFERIRGS